MWSLCKLRAFQPESSIFRRPYPAECRLGVPDFRRPLCHYWQRVKTLHQPPELALKGIVPQCTLTLNRPASHPSRKPAHLEEDSRALF